jgi:NTE family protein
MQRQQFDAVSPQADILIQPAVGGYSPRDFERSRELVDLGRAAALEKIEDIRNAIHQWENQYAEEK